MKKGILPLILTTAFSGICVFYTSAQETNPVTPPDNGSIANITVPTVGALSSGNARDIFTIAAGLNDNATLVSAIKACGMESGLRTRGAITIFAPCNSAFSKLPPGFVDQLMKPENASILNKISSYHIIMGNHSSVSIKEAIKAGKGHAVFTTLSGNKLVATLEDNRIRLTDDGDNACFITMSDIKGNNGTIHVLDKVALPR